jgi:hypothetical protein
MMQAQTHKTEKMFRRFKNLPRHLQEGEIPVYSIPAIWESGQEQGSTACDIILTNQRLFGYIYARFPRERLFLDALPLDAIRAVSLRQETFEPVFRELLVRTAARSVYIRAPRQKIEGLYDALQSATGQGMHTSSPAYGRQEVRTSFERSPLAIMLLFVGGLILEIGGALLWLLFQSAQAGLPLCIAGFVAVATAILVARQRR